MTININSYVILNVVIPILSTKNFPTTLTCNIGQQLRSRNCTLIDVYVFFLVFTVYVRVYVL